ncbi:MAG: hypothetical protein ACTHK3_05250 [Solirubrobacterales bacterium]
MSAASTGFDESGEPRDDRAGSFVKQATRGEVDSRPGVLEAELDRYAAGTERERAQTAIVLSAAESTGERERERTEIGLRIAEKRTDAEIKDQEERRKAELSDQERRTMTEMNGLESHDRTTEVERYFFMAVIAIGMLATIVLAFMTVGQPLEYRLSPLAGLAVSGGGGLRLRGIARASARTRIESRPSTSTSASASID